MAGDNNPVLRNKDLEERIMLPQMDAEKVADEIGDFMINEITSIGYKGGVIGLSGGVDSTVSAALAKRAFDSYNSKNPDNPLELLGYILPSAMNSSKDTEDGIKVAETLGIRYFINPIDENLQSYKKGQPQLFNNNSDARKCLGNLMAEIRATILHSEAGLYKMLVIGTGNKDEDFRLNYYTMFGDGAVHINPLGNLPKRLVKQMAVHLGFRAAASREPTAALEPNQTDFKDIGYRYETGEIISEGFEQGLTRKQVINNPIVTALCRNDINDYRSLFGKDKFTSASEIVGNVVSRNLISQGKMRIIHPPSAPVTLIYDYGNQQR